MNSIMRSLELIPSESQFVASAAQLALRTLKYQPLEPESVAHSLQSLLKSSQSTLWTERAVALQFMQYFWFRNAILLGEEGSQTVLREAMRLLEDPKLEVRDMACATVSGVIRIMTPASQRECRNLIISRSQEVFPDRKRRRRTDGRSSSDELIDSTAVRHGAVLGLKALVISSPYDVPEWLPEVLMSLVRLASEPAPVRSTVRESLSEFRRTHEEGGLLAIKDAISAEHWEAIRDVATPANYFV
jgi:proteasome activator subunit 4